MPHHCVTVVVSLVWLGSAFGQDEKPPVKAKPTIAIQTEALGIKPGDALSARALVTRPPALKGVVSWSLETRRHRGNFSVTALSPDGKLVASGGLDGTVRLWDAESGKLVHALIGHNSYVYGLDFSPDGAVLASAGSFDTTVRLWDVRSGMPLRVLKQQIEVPRYLVQVAWSPDGQSILAAGGDSGTMSRWNAATGNYQTKFEFGRPVQAIAWSPDGRTAAIIAPKLPVQLWDAGTNKIAKTVGDLATDYRSLAWSPDGKTLAAGTATSTIFFDAATGEEKLKLDGQGQAVAWSSDGKTLATAMPAGAAIKLWDAAEGKVLKTIPGAAYSLHFAPDDKSLVGGDYAAFTVYGVEDMKPLRRFEIAGTSPPYWWSGKPVLTGIGTAKLSLWDAVTGKLTKTLEGHAGAVNFVAWSIDGKTLASASDDKTVKLWDTTTGKVTRTLEGHTAAVLAVAWSADGKSLASGGHDKQIVVWDAGSGKTLQTFKGSQDAVTCLAFAPGSAGTLAAGGNDKRVRLFNVKTGQAGKSFEDAGGEVAALAWSVNGQTVVSGHYDHRARMWQVSSGKLLHTLESDGSPPQVSALAWAPNDALLASGRGNHTMQLWNVKTGALVHSVPTMAPVQRVAWTPDSRTVVCSSADRTARFFDAGTGLLRGMLLAEDGQVVAVAADGHYRADGSGNELLVVAQLDKGQETMTPAAFGTKFKWKNTASMVKLTGK